MLALYCGGLGIVSCVDMVRRCGRGFARVCVQCTQTRANPQTTEDWAS
jgi:hypothetical protein